MKKYVLSYKYKRYNLRHSKKSLDRSLKYKFWRADQNRKLQGLPREKREQITSRRNFVTVTAPTDFSFIKNPIKVIFFINYLKNLQEKKKKVFIDLENVKRIDNDAIVVLLSIMFRFKSEKIVFNGNFPKDKHAKSSLSNSGFFKYLYREVSFLDRYEIISENNIYTHAQKNVDSKLSAAIIEKASETIWDSKRRCQGAQRVLLELMQNTNNHASIGSEGEKHWWLSVNHIINEKKVSFSFVDYGVGVFKSLNNKQEGSKFYNWASKLFERIKFGNNAD